MRMRLAPEGYLPKQEIVLTYNLLKISTLRFQPFHLCPPTVPEICDTSSFVDALLPSGDKIMKECPRLKSAASFVMISD